jgi:hypothetical protein
VAEIERPSTPIWWYLLVAVAVVVAVFWLLGAVISFVVGIVKLAALIILGLAVIGYVVSRKVDR